MTQLYLIRHGDYVPQSDALSERGIWQANRLRDRLAATGEIRPDVLISSTLRRAMETTAILASTLGQPITADSALEEWHNTDGLLTGQELVAILRDQPPDQRVFYRPGESAERWVDFQLRAASALNRLTQTYADQTICVVCHGGIIEASLLFFCGLSTLQLPPIVMEPAHTSITCWRRIPVMGDFRWSLDRFNDASHLQEAIAWA